MSVIRTCQIFIISQLKITLVTNLSKKHEIDSSTIDQKLFTKADNRFAKCGVKLCLYYRVTTNTRGHPAIAPIKIANANPVNGGANKTVLAKEIFVDNASTLHFYYKRTYFYDLNSLTSASSRIDDKSRCQNNN